eukprot:9005734-Alexandrium_andersonii.AAC.1
MWLRAGVLRRTARGRPLSIFRRQRVRLPPSLMRKFLGWLLKLPRSRRRGVLTPPPRAFVVLRRLGHLLSGSRYFSTCSAT